MKHYIFRIKKTFLISILLSFFSLFLYSENYKITEVIYKIEGNGPSFFGVTTPYALENKVPIDKEKTFETLDELNKYLNDYKRQLKNTRAFEFIEVTPSIDSNNNVILTVELHDSLHIMAVPYGKYDSNNGFVGKIKFKDSNFLGTLNTLSTDLNTSIKSNTKTDELEYGLGVTFKYNYPFKIGIFNTEWINNYNFSYTFGDSSPEWNLKTGLQFTLPQNNFSYVFLFTQGFNHNFDYTGYNDEYYFDDDLKFSIPITVCKLFNWSKLIYKPYVEFKVNWDTNGINIKNSSLSSPIASIGHSLSTSRIDWVNNYRNGINCSITNYFAYNIQRNILYPVIKSDLCFYKGFELFEGNYFNRIGFTGDLYTVFYLHDYSNLYFLKDGENIGPRLRGIRDDQLYSSVSSKACLVPAAICLNFDIPYRILQTNFTSDFFKYFNFDMQISPFIDMALTYNKSTKKWFDPKDGFYTAGIEVLVYPEKFSSFTLRASLGIDIGRQLFDDYLNMDWRRNVSPYELFIGMGLQY